MICLLSFIFTFYQYIFVYSKPEYVIQYLWKKQKQKQSKLGKEKLAFSFGDKLHLHSENIVF